MASLLVLWELLLVTLKFNYSLFLKNTFQKQYIYIHTIPNLIHNFYRQYYYSGNLKLFLNKKCILNANYQQN